MNFISHYKIDQERETNFCLGTVLPDLMRVPLPKLKLFGASKNMITNSKEEELLLKGMRKHFEVDKYFHNSEFMKIHTSTLKRDFLKNSLEKNGIKLFFVTHILCEMLLDRVLLLNEPNLGNNFYAMLESSKPSDVSRLLNKNSMYDAKKFTQFFEQFRSARYLFSYLEIEGLFYALNRICKGVGTQSFGPEDFDAFKSSVEETETQMRIEYNALFDEIKNSLN